MVDNLATVPIVALALGSVAGLGAARVATRHYALMVRDTSQVFVAGPPVVARLGEHVTKEELGGSHIHGTNGTVDDVVDSEHEAFDRTRRFLSYLPSSVYDLPPRGPVVDDPERRDEWLHRARCPTTAARSTRCGASSKRSSTPARGSRSAPGGGVRPSPGWPGSTAGRWAS